MSYDRTKYFMDDPRESQRLDSKVDPDRFIGDFLSPILKSGPEKIVDVGCGAGAIIAALAKKFPEKEFAGVDISAPRIAEAKKKTDACQNVVFYEASIYDIPLETSSVDLVFTRFLLEYLKEPINAVAELGRIIRPGGTVVLQDLDGQLLFQWPYAVPEIETFFAVLHKKTGFDPYIGRKLYSYSRKAGLSLKNIDVRPYHLFVGRIDDHNYHLWDMKFEIAMPELSEALGGRIEAERFKEKYMKFLLNEDTLLYSVLFTLYLTKAA